MALISIEEQQAQEPNRWAATLSFQNGPKYTVSIINPFSKEQEEDLEWYFEEHLRFPFTDKVRARKAAESIPSYGETLFNQVFADRQAFRTYGKCIGAGLPTVQIEIAGSPAFHSLHWEALKDPGLPMPLSLQSTMVRKNLRPSTLEAIPRPSPTINVLVVAARPSGRYDMGYRTISRPLVELLRQTNLPVQIELLRPGTYEALDHHLRTTSTQQGVGYYQVIHFDVHGALLSYQEFQRGQHANRYIYQERYGRPDLASYEGEKAFLFFEDPQDKQADPVEASELAALLIAHQVPIAILNACQSGKQVGVSETSLGSRLMQAGVQLVLAMGYSVTVSAAELLMKTLYAELFAHRELSTAISMARHELFNRKERRVYYNQKLDLEDWLLPVVYQNQPVQLNARPLTTEEVAHRHERDASRYAPSQPRYGFVGRDLDILQIEKRLLTRRNVLLIRGMGGAGKTTLLHHLGSWWQTTRFVEEVFYFGYDERAWTRQQIITSIAKRLMSKVEYLSTFQPLSLDAQQSLLAGRLRAHRHLLILDNLESITGAHLAIQHTLSKKEQEALHRFLKDLAGGQTLVLLGSRGGEAWLAAETFVDNVYDLPGLDAEAASALVERILERYGATKYRQDKHLPTLLALLDGFPLALEVVLANLARQSPEEVLAALQAGDVQLKTGDSQKKTENILRCIDYSHSNLSPEAQSLLTCLAPFTSVVFVNIFDGYSKLLKEQAALAHLPFDRWQNVLQEAANWGLLAPDPDQPAFLRLQPILPYFLRTRLNAPEQAAVRQAVETAFLALYNEWGGQLYTLLESKKPQERQTGLVLTQYEYENLLFAVNLALDAQTSILDPYYALSDYFDLTQDPQRGLEVAQEIRAHLTSSKGGQSHDQVNKQLVRVLDDGARWLTQLKRFAEAERYLQQALQIHIESNDRHSQAQTYHNLGNVAQEQRQFEQAEQYYQQALQIYIEYNDRHFQARTYNNLGAGAREQRQFEQAQQYYQQALQIFIEYDDRHSQAQTYYNLGRMAEVQRQFEQAQQYYQQALQIYIEFNDHYEQAGTYHQLGRVAEEQHQWEKAQTAFSTALDICVKYDDTYHITMTLNSLARIWKVTGEASLLLQVASTLGVAQEEVEALFREMLGDEAGEAGDEP